MTPADKALLAAATAVASHHKVPFGMPEAERRRLMDVLLTINAIAMQTFDMLEADRISEHDVMVMLQLPDYCNTFTKAIETHARGQIA